jgi:hypothetical protein
MTFKSRVAVPAVLLAALFALPSLADKRRAVTPRSPGAPIVAEVSGTITDAVTSTPVVNVHVRGGRRSSETDAQGKFSIKNADGFTDIVFDAERSGYEPYHIKLSGAGPHNLTIRLQPTPTVSVKKIDGTTIAVDFENLRFGYAVPFLGFRAAPSELFCFGSGDAREVNKSEMRKITGPGVNVTSGCCTARMATKVTLELKTNQTSDVYFVDSCESEYTQELIGTNHVTGEAIDIPFSGIAEVVFP